MTLKDKEKIITDYLYKRIIRWMFFLIIFCVCIDEVAAINRLTGIVRDAISGEPLIKANIFQDGSNEMFLTDSLGYFSIPVKNSNKIQVRYEGYKDLDINLRNIDSDAVILLMNSQITELDEVVVKPKKVKYSKKNNPAVELIQKVKRDYDYVDPLQSPEYSFEKYEKILLGANHFKVNFDDKGKYKQKYKYLEQYIDTAPWTGSRILDLALLEKNSIILHTKKPENKKEIVTGILDQGIQDMIDAANVRTSLNDVIREANIYDNDIYLLQNKFVSPLANIGPDFYKYHLIDTVSFGGDRCIEVSFAPKVPETFGFNGKLFIPLDDSVKYVKRVSMRAPKAMNLNYLDNIFISQNFEKDSLGKIHKTLDDICLELKIINALPPLYAIRQTRYDGFRYNFTDTEKGYLELKGDYVELSDAENRDNAFWNDKRRIDLSHAEKNLAGLVDNLRQSKLIYWGEKILKPLINGYVGTLPKGSKFNIGPVNTFVSYNDLEGLRLKLGGMSTSALSDHFFFRGYGAYGFKDKTWKYQAEVEYSFIKKKNHSREFPMNGIRATYQFETDPIGVRYLYSNPDNVILSIKRKKNDLIIYRRKARLEYNLELANHLSFNIGYQRDWYLSSSRLIFKNGLGESFHEYGMGAFFAQVRYAPDETFVQGTTNRRPVNMDAPIITLKQEYGPKRFLGANYTMNKTELSFKKRFWFSAFGYTNILVKGEKIWSQVPFPALLWQNANLSYTIQQESFALLNPMEFALDQYVSWDAEYFAGGALFNRIPLLKKARLREVISFKGFFGSLSRKNNPDLHPDLLSFPKNSETRLMGKMPYMELGVGIDNILTLLRVDYVWRLTYRNSPNVDRGGVRVSFHLSF